MSIRPIAAALLAATFAFASAGAFAQDAASTAPAAKTATAGKTTTKKARKHHRQKQAKTEAAASGTAKSN
ncbi:hypothetical protein [Luteimonas aquatica]|uniref:hypothetical protein n=1 Tax=Luteimonas aquatica TaxID=450364 RepID=UPI001F581CD0|nr:hypothetical protein [Luteimonas aquatica]